MSLVTDLLLGVATLSAWLACVGFARLQGPLDRLHCATFVVCTAGPAVLAAALTSQGGSVRGQGGLLAGVPAAFRSGPVSRDRACVELARPARSRPVTVLLLVLFLLTAVAGAGVALTRDPRRQALAIAANGLVLALLFLALQAPDVAFSELAVGTAAIPLLFLVVLAAMRTDRKPD